MNHREKAKELFLKGYNCSQAVFAAFCDVTETDEETALKISSSFGGGLGRMREVCGALSGAAMVLGILYGNTDPEKKEEHYARIQDFAAMFKEKCGSIICRDLLELKPGENCGAAPDTRTAEYYKSRPCAFIVETAAELLDDYITSRNF